MDTVNLRNAIYEAEHHEALSHELAQLLKWRLDHLHSTIRVCPTNPVKQLLDFVAKFVNRTAPLLDSIIAYQRTDNEDLTDTLVATCTDFFVAPPPILADCRGMNGAMNKSYLCHRIVEEVNDAQRVVGGTPLTSLDFTCSNLIVHQLIGEPFANQLDDFVLRSANKLRPLCRPCSGAKTQPNLGLNTTRGHNTSGRQQVLPDDRLAFNLFTTGVFASTTMH